MTEQEISPEARTSRKRNPEESRRKILNSAESAFSRRGFDGARLRDIAQDAGVHHALVHHYYGDKRGLFQAVMQRGLRRMSGLGVQTVSPEDGLELVTRKLVGGLFDFLADNKNLLRIIEGAYRDRESVSYSVAREVLGTETRPLFDMVKLVLGQGQTAGRLRTDIPPESLLLYCVALVVYPFIMGSGLARALGLPRYGVEQREREKKQLIALIIQALRPLPI